MQRGRFFMQGNRIVHHATKILLEIMFYGGIAICAVLPYFMPMLMEHIGASIQFRTAYTIILMSSGACAIYIVFQLRKMYKTLLGGNPFVQENVSCLGKCAVAGAIIAVIFLIRLVLWFTLAAAVIVIIFSILTLFCLTIKDLFKQAVAYKEEADWTV
jgi:predicted secreted protein